MSKKKRLLKVISRILVIIGIALILLFIVLEAYSYPWGTIFNSEIEDVSLPDPPPIAFKGEDAESILMESTEARLETPIEETGASEILPGAKKVNTYIPSYLKLGVIKIPRINLSQYILEGTDRQMDYGVGHIVGSADLGSSGNSALSGHNSSSFRYLNKLSSGDLIIIERAGNVYTYTMYDSFIVTPDKTWVLNPIDSEKYLLTLITCTSYSLSSDRLIVRARLTNINGIEPATYYEVLNASTISE